MKSQVTLMVTLFFAVSSLGQSLSEKEAVLKKCIEFPTVQEVLSKTPDNKVYIMQHSISFDAETNLTNSENELVFLSKPEIYNQNVETFILFRKFDISSQTADVEFSIYQDFTTSPVNKKN